MLLDSSPNVNRPYSGSVVTRRLAQDTTEHGREARGALVAEVQRDRRHRLTGGKPRQGREQAGLLSPLGETGAGFTAEQPGEAAPVHVQIGGPVVDRLAHARLFEERGTTGG